MKVFSIEDWFIYFLFLSREISAVLWILWRIIRRVQQVRSWFIMEIAR